MCTNHKNNKKQYTHHQPLNRLFQILVFPSILNDWFNLHLNIKNAELVSLFKSRLLSFICPVQRSIYNIFDPKGLLV